MKIYYTAIIKSVILVAFTVIHMIRTIRLLLNFVIVI